LSFISIFHKALNFIFEFDFEIAFESVPGTNYYLDFLQYSAFYSIYQLTKKHVIKLFLCHLDFQTAVILNVCNA